MALLIMRKCGIIHCDIKPDNILVNEKRNILKLCDFGTALSTSEKNITQYLASRFYRAPEIIMGLEFSHGIDMWALGCTIYELYTADILFKGRNNNEMLKLMMDLKGRIPKKMLTNGMFSSLHFDKDGTFIYKTFDKIDIVERIQYSNSHSKIKEKIPIVEAAQDIKKAEYLVDFIDKCLILNPDKRVKIEDALNHPFLKK